VSDETRRSASFLGQMTPLLHWEWTVSSVFLTSFHQLELQPEGHKSPGIVHEVSPSIESMSAIAQDLMWILKYRVIAGWKDRLVGADVVSYATLQRSNTITTQVFTSESSDLD
jgi:hypothetical protein